MYDLIVPKYDYGYDLEFLVLEDDDSEYDLTDYTVTFRVWKSRMHQYPILSEACAMVSAADGTCKYTVQENDFDVAGEYLCELELTKQGAVESTRNYKLLVEDSP